MQVGNEVTSWRVRNEGSNRVFFSFSIRLAVVEVVLRFHHKKSNLSLGLKVSVHRNPVANGLQPR